MAVSMDMIQHLARGVAKSGMKYMLEDLARNIRKKAANRTNLNDERLLNSVAESIEEINVGKYF